MASHKVVTIGVPVRNGERFIEECLQSLLAQDYGNIKIMVSDNASSDSTMEIVNRYVCLDSRVTLMTLQNPVTASENFSSVLESADTEFFMWAAHDDLWSADYVATLVERLERDSKAVLAYSKTALISEDRLNSIVVIRGELPARNDNGFFAFKAPYLTQPFHIYGLMRTDAARRCSFGSAWGSDRQFLMQLRRYGLFIYDERPTFFYFRERTPKSMEEQFRAFSLSNQPKFLATRSALQAACVRDRLSGARCFGPFELIYVFFWIGVRRSRFVSLFNSWRYRRNRSIRF